MVTTLGKRVWGSTLLPMAARVLIVDDHPAFRAAARRLLELEGYDVVGEAEDGLSAIAAARALRPDFILLDVQLPDLDGFEVASSSPATRPPGGRAHLQPGPQRLRSLPRDEPCFRVPPQGRALGRGDRGYPRCVKLAIIGGGGFRVPLVYGALLRRQRVRRCRAARRRRRAARAHRRTCSKVRPPSTATACRSARPPTSTTRSRAPTSCSPRSGSAGSRAGRSTRACRSATACSGRRPPGPAASASRCARSRRWSTSRSGSRGARRARGWSTSPTPPGWSPRRSSRCSATGRSASATRRRRSAAASPPRSAARRRTCGSTTSGSTTSAGCERVRDGSRRPPARPAGRRRRARARSRRARCSAPSGCARSG